jgi:hypothetical protein
VIHARDIASEFLNRLTNRELMKLEFKKPNNESGI